MARKRRLDVSPYASLRFITTVLLSFLAIAPIAAESLGGNDNLFNPQQPIVLPPSSSGGETRHLNLRLQHILHHGTDRHPCLRRLDIPTSAPVWYQEEDQTSQERSLVGRFSVATSPLSIQRLADRRPSHLETLMSAGRAQGSPLSLPSSAWTVDRIPGPNVTDQETVLSFARMASDAYVTDPESGEWVDVGCGFNYTKHFGWETDGLRGHVFADETNQTIVIGLKGTSLAVFDGAESTTNDKINDNLFFSCCCGQGGSVLWRQVCDCKTATYTCNSTCVVKSLREKDRYYYASQQLYHNVTELYPDADIWLAGHSLGGAVSALLGLTYGLPAVTFEAPGDAMPAARLGLPTPPGYRIGEEGDIATTGAYHFGHTGDPVYMGTCSSCSIASYAMESVCHSGMECRYDTVKDLGFHSYIGNHKISTVIRDVLEAYDEPAKCEVVSDCIDCFNWKYFESNSSDPITSSSSSSSSSSSTSFTRTRTETCKTPGWWGCLDQTSTTSTTTSTSSSSSTSTSTSTCKTPGWFGCLDESETTSTSLSTTTSEAMTSPTSILTSSCATPGWFRCRDAASTTISAQPSKIPTIPTETAPRTAPTTPPCRYPFGWGCNRRKADAEVDEEPVDVMVEDSWVLLR